jgi:O-succinylbenzoic acid--CoA ligase
LSGHDRCGWLNRLAHHRGEGEALFVAGTSIDYATLVTRANATAEQLRILGVAPGDVVAVLAPPSAAGVALIHGMLDRGFVMFPLSQRLSEREQSDALARTHTRFLVISHGVDSLLAKRLCDAAGCGLLEFSSVDATLTREIGLACLQPPLDLDSNRAADHRAQRLAERAAVVLQTSGTGGRPKAAILTLDNLIASAEASAELLGSNENDRWLLCMPLFHIGGLSILIRSALLGTSVVLHVRFDARRVASALDEDRITQVSFVATMLAKVIDVRGERSVPESL